MKSVAQKIAITLGCITLVALCVMPVFVDAQTTAATVTAELKEVNAKGLSVILFPIIGGLYISMTVVAALLGFSGLILDAIINLTIVDLSTNISKIAAINSTWKVIRDLANMSFIFILLYEGIRMVLGLGGTGIKKVVSGIIMAAILVNFSLFFTKVIIDASNIVTLGFYRSIVSSGTGTSGITTGLNAGLTGAYMSALKISSLYAPGNALTTIFSGLPGVFVLSANSIFLLIAVFIFLAITVMFVIRYIAFILLLIMSPVYFASMAIPGLSGFKDKFIQTLTSQALWGPVFMLLTWVMLTLAGDTNFLNLAPDQTLVGALTNPGKDTISVIINYIIIIGLLIQTLVLSKSVATKAGYVTSKIIDKGQSYIGGAVFGGASWAGRSTLGRVGQKWTEDKDLKERAARGDVGARFKLLAGNKLATSSFDARNTDTVGAITKQTGSFGKGINTKGYKGYVDEQLKKQGEADKNRAEQFKVPEDKASLEEYEKQIKVDPTIEGTKRDARKTVLDELITEEKARVSKDANELTAEITRIAAERTTAEGEKQKIEKTLRDLREKIRVNSLAGISTTAEEALLKTEEAKLPAVLKTFNTVTSNLQEKNRALREVNKNVIKLEDEVKDINDGIWISPEYAQLIADAGGRKEEKKDGKIKKKGVSSTSNTNILAYAERVKGKTGLFSGLPNFRIDNNYSKRRADAVRKLAKVEKNTDKIEKLMKDIAKEDADDTAAPTPAVAPAAAPAAPTPPTATP